MSLVLFSAMLVGLGSTGPIEQPTSSYSLLNELTSVEMFNASLLSSPAADDRSPELSYTYLEFGGTRTDVDATGKDADTYYLEGSMELGDLFYLLGVYQYQDANFGGIYANTLGLGGGAHFGLTPKLDIFSDLMFLWNDTNGSSTGYQFRVGPRWLVLKWLELNGALAWIDLERIASSDDGVGWDVGARGHFGAISVGATYGVMDGDDDWVGLDLRLSL